MKLGRDCASAQPSAYRRALGAARYFCSFSLPPR
jgi:hypothetical protein